MSANKSRWLMRWIASANAANPMKIMAPCKLNKTREQQPRMHLPTNQSFISQYFVHHDIQPSWLIVWFSCVI